MKVSDEKIKVTSICLKEATRWLGAVSAMYTLPVKKELERPARILRVRSKKVLKSTKGAPGQEQEGHSVTAADFEGRRQDNDEPGYTLLNSLSMVSSGSLESDSVELTTNCWSPTSTPLLLMSRDVAPAYPACTPLKSLSLAGSIKKNNVMGPIM